MSPRRRIQTEVTETDDQGGLAQTNVFETEGQDGWARRHGFPSHEHSCVPSALALRFGDGCHRDPKLKTEVRCVCVCVCVCACACACVCVLL